MKLERRFAYAVAPVQDELLDGWAYTMARGHGTTLPDLLGHSFGSLDWSPPQEALQRLSEGAQIDIPSLRAMTLPAYFPDQTRDTLCSVRCPSERAFCPACAEEDLHGSGRIVFRAKHARLLSPTCLRHQMFLRVREGLDPRGTQDPWLSLHDPTPCPPFFPEFQQAIIDAHYGVAPPDFIVVRSAAELLSVTRDIWCLVGSYGSEALWALSYWLTRERRRSLSAFELDFAQLGYLNAEWRSHLMLAAALLLTDPSRHQFWDTQGWARDRAAVFGGYNEPAPLADPWRRCITSMSGGQVQWTYELADRWPKQLAFMVRDQLKELSRTHGMFFMRRAGSRRPR